MKLFLLLSLISLTATAKNVIIGHFDPFDGAQSNNSETVAKMVARRLQAQGINVKICSLQTSFQRAYPQFEECLKDTSSLDLVIGLGETGCKLKAEFVGRNLDKTYGPDNLGVERDNTPIIKGADPFLSLRYPLPQMYCALPRDLRKKIVLSNNAGSFVCNNTAYQMRYHHPERMIGFIHVPQATCRNVAVSNTQDALIIEKMIIAGMKTTDNGVYLPHYSNSEEIPLTRREIKTAHESVDSKCYQDFYNEIKGVDSRGLWPF